MIPHVYVHVANLVLTTIILVLFLLGPDLYGRFIQHFHHCLRQWWQILHFKRPNGDTEPGTPEEDQKGAIRGTGPWRLEVAEAGTWGTGRPRKIPAELKTVCGVKQAFLQYARMSMEGQAICTVTNKATHFMPTADRTSVIIG